MALSTITDTLSMTGVMLPLAAGVNAARLKIRLIILAIDVRVVDIYVAVNVDVDLPPRQLQPPQA